MARVPTGRLTQNDLAALANRWEPDASSSPPDYRAATCVVCASPMTRMWHLWLHTGGFKKELHMCSGCGRHRGLDKTLIVFPAVNHDFDMNFVTMTGGAVVRIDTSEGGHPTGALLRAYREHPDFSSYLLVQDSMRGLTDDVVQPFRERPEPVVAWCAFPLNFDGDDQLRWVQDQYPGVTAPKSGVFGPVFYATREALEQTEPWFPRTPGSRMEAQGTERAWAYAFHAAGVEVGALHGFDEGAMFAGDCLPFQKTFARRP